MEVTYAGTVLTLPRFFHGKHSRYEHEQFDCRDARGATFRVIDNVTIGPRIPVRPGDHVTVKGELVHDRGAPPIVHFTHHDPWKTHEDGFVRLDGRTYA
ncbi:hypothetical protein WPS_21580 [Vulcanimicrobium alpinum]|uniref:DUF3465 domain-containing protein n=1 Tax=Vulcanimicrobium alpinum TaxID=3016050 RepID=A0AAN2CAR6_UNVUL|nr:hypothetical protein WPS_21580 [Vulcanimicrobium alpinum]